MKEILFAAVLAYTGSTSAADLSGCAWATEQFTLGANYVTAAGQRFGKTNSQADAAAVISALQDMDNFLQGTRAACGMSPPSTAEQREVALRQIEEWTQEQAKKDRRFKKIEFVLQPLMARLVLTLPPQYWLPMLQLTYEAVSNQITLLSP